MEEFHRIRRLPPYVFEEVNRAKAVARNAGADIIDLGMGNPDLPAPVHVIDKLKETIGKPRTDRYSASRGIAGLRVIDASIMPTAPRGNTNIPTIMVAEKISATMVDEARAAA